MDPSIVEAVKEWGPWVFIAIISLRETLPKLAPDIFKLLSKRMTVEDRLFNLLEQNTKALLELKHVVEGLALTIVQVNTRVDKLEDLIRDDGTAAFIRWFKTLPAYRDLQHTEINQAHAARQRKPDHQGSE